MSEEFFEHIGELLKSSDFSDVTIVSDDQKIFKGHRNILSGFSPVLKNLFKIDTNNQPALLYLNGINSSHINAIMEFIYCNTIPKTWTKQLQSAVISLEIKGLQEQIPDTQLNLPSLPEIEIEKTPSLRRALFSDHKSPVESQEKVSTNADDVISKATDAELSKSNLIGLPIAKGYSVKVKFSDLVEMRSQHSLNESLEKPETNDKTSQNESHEETEANDKTSQDESNKKTPVYLRTCNQCNPAIQFTSKFKWTNHLSQHKEVVKVYKCEMCNFKASQRVNLQQHINKSHLGRKDDTPCDQCDYNPRDRRNLIKHKKAVHEGLRYPCNFCEYKSTSPQSLKDHISSIHEGIKYQCHQCEKQFSQYKSLYTHIKAIHEGKQYKCEFCEYYATERGHLLVHFQKMHKDIDVEIFREKMRSSSRLRGPRKTTEESLGQEGQSKI